MDDRIHTSSIVLHRGEEPPISGEKGIVNVFFSSCNMQCVYCQNWEISCRGTQGAVMTLDEVCDAIIKLLPLSENNLGFVSPTHFTLQMVSIVEELRRRGYNPTIIYNTNGYDLPETLRTLEDIVDVWLPDFKYSDDKLAVELSLAPQYSEYALAAFKEMVRQVGTTLHTDDRGIARRGIIIRNLVLPGQVENSIGVLKLIAENLSPNLHISLMSQYYPPDNLLTQNRKSKIANLNLQRSSRINPVHGSVPMKSGVSGRKFLHRTVTRQEYETIAGAFHDLGFTNGWLQDYQSHKNYRPDFSRDHPFE
ncbi:MAG: radical SAM protein [Bacteroidales bacterium]|nr:radical SAM protein [Bacteroidales bacterium]